MRKLNTSRMTEKTQTPDLLAVYLSSDYRDAVIVQRVSSLDSSGHESLNALWTLT